MFIEKYPNFKTATEGVTLTGRKYSFERYDLEAGESMPWHLHPKAEEIIIIDEGIFLLAVGINKEIYEIQKGDETVTIHISLAESHALLAISNVSFVAYKTPAENNGTTFLKGPNLKKELQKMRKVVEAYRQKSKTLEV